MLRRVALFAALCAVPFLSFNCSAASSNDDDGVGSGAGGGGLGAGGGLGSGGSSFNGEECGSTTFGNQVPGSLLIVLDKSGSMSDTAGSTTKWSATAAAINTMIGSADPSTEMGLLAYPEGNFDDFALASCLLNPAGPNCPAILADAGCRDVATAAHVPIAELNQSGGPMASWLNQSSPAGNTPTLWALRNGYAILAAHGGTGQKYALLMTDGEPTVHTPAMLGLPEMAQDCGSQADIEQEVANASSNGTATFVIGSPGSEPAATFLSQLALNGSTAKSATCSAAAGDCHYQIGSGNFQQELADVLQQIAGVISDCIFDLPQGEDVDPTKVNVTVETPNGPVEIYKDPSHADGWDYTDSSQTKIQLFGPACELYKNQQGNTIRIILGCETVLK